jgi:hypothetical protein
VAEGVVRVAEAVEVGVEVVAVVLAVDGPLVRMMSLR